MSSKRSEVRTSSQRPAQIVRAFGGHEVNVWAQFIRVLPSLVFTEC